MSAKLRQDPSIDSVVTLGPSLGVAVQQQLEQDGNTAKVVTYAFNNDLIPLLQNGKVAFTIDQQPYLQGYLSIDSLWLYKKNKSVIGAQQSVPTGPVVIDQTNIGDIARRRERRPALRPHPWGRSPRRDSGGCPQGRARSEPPIYPRCGSKLNPPLGLVILMDKNMAT